MIDHHRIFLCSLESLTYSTLLTFLSQHALQLWHLLPCFDAGHSLLSWTWLVLFAPSSPTVLVFGHQVTGRCPIMCEENLIVKFVGTMAGSMSFKYCASRVGNQCLTPGVALQTSKMFLRCCTLWRSPESCHLNQLCPCLSFELICTVIAAVHCG